MIQFKWNDSISFQMPSMANQHQAGVEALNDMREAVVRGRSRQTAGEVLSRLAGYAHPHFPAEESLLKRTD